MRKPLSIALAALVVACGDVRTASNPGDPIYIVNGQVQGSALAAPRGEYRAALQLISVGQSELADCFNSSQGLEALDCFALGSEARVTAQDVAIEPVFPVAFEIPLYALPSGDALLDDAGAVLAFGYVLVYDDGNLNADLDPTDFSAAEAVDVVVGSSSFSSSGQTASYLIYREGTLHPLWSVFEQMYGCGEVPPGFSVVTIDTRSGPVCTVATDAPVLVSLIDDPTVRGLVCTGTPPWTPTQSPYPAEPIPADAVVTCSDDGFELSYYREQGHYCDAALVQSYALEGCTTPGICMYHPSYEGYYDLRNDPPAWWPCPTEQVCLWSDTDTGSLSGTYALDGGAPVADTVEVQVMRFTNGPGSLDDEGSGVRLVSSDFGPSGTEFHISLNIYESAPDGNIAVSGQTYDLPQAGYRPVYLHVSRRNLEGGLTWTRISGGQIELARWSSEPCASNEVILRDVAVPGAPDRGLEDSVIDAAFDFKTPPVD
ncbi:MAG: hypothetical protein JXR83_22370 [Deltaproteobacteria bacterium]|nr:hypothetical protein [Deltaproteobacteria bacterium]